MPNRIIRDGRLDSARIDALSELAELFYTRLWNVVDDYGRFEYDPLVLLAKTWPRRIHRYTPAQVEEWVAECTAGKKPLIVLYEVDGKRYLEVQDFRQRIRKSKEGVSAPSKFPGREAAASAAFFDGAAVRGFSPRSAARATTAAAATPSPSHTAPEAAAEVQQELWPETTAVVQELHPGADLAPKLAAAAAAIVPAIADVELAAALVRTHRGKRQQSAGLWLKTVPEYLRGLAVLRNRDGPSCATEEPLTVEELRSRIADVDGFLATCRPRSPDHSGWSEMRAQLGQQMEDVEARKPPGVAVREEKCRRKEGGLR